MHLIELKHVTYTYPLANEPALKDINCTLEKGEFYGVIGENAGAMDMDIFVIDEPTSQLDPDGTEEIFEIIHMLKEQGKTIILVEHKVDLLAEYADEIIVMGEGKILSQGPVREVLSDRSMMEKGAMIPQAALLAYALEEEGITLPYIPVTREECIKLLKERRGA